MHGVRWPNQQSGPWKVKDIWETGVEKAKTIDSGSDADSECQVDRKYGELQESLSKQRKKEGQSFNYMDLIMKYSGIEAADAPSQNKVKKGKSLKRNDSEQSGASSVSRGGCGLSSFCYRQAQPLIPHITCWLLVVAAGSRPLLSTLSNSVLASGLLAPCLPPGPVHCCTHWHCSARSLLPPGPVHRWHCSPLLPPGPVYCFHHSPAIN